MDKKHILFVIDSLGIGGAEKSLSTLLSLLDYTRFKVDLQLFAYGGSLEKFLPAEVNVLPPLNYTRFLSQPIWRQLCRPAMFWARLKYSLKIRRRGLLNSEKAGLYWQTIGGQIAVNPKNYDAAIAYAQGIPTFYIADKVSASKKLAWVNIDYRLSKSIRDYQRSFYKSCDTIVLVSEYVHNVFSEIYPEFTDKMRVMRDIINSETIESMSGLQPDKVPDSSHPVLMTAGRLENSQKGYDLALEAAKILKSRRIKFKWYAIGEGPSRGEIERYIIDNDLQDCFILLGATANPYAYMRLCDIYVQPSRREGFGLTIAEARILNKPVVCTDFEGCTMQIVNGKNGLITSFNPEDIADAIERLLSDHALYSDIAEYLRNEKKGNTEEIGKFYELIEG